MRLRRAFLIAVSLARHYTVRIAAIWAFPKVRPADLSRSCRGAARAVSSKPWNYPVLGINHTNPDLGLALSFRPRRQSSWAYQRFSDAILLAWPIASESLARWNTSNATMWPRKSIW
jgi:hypothetical protein